MGWQPVLEGTMAETARELVLDIARSVAAGASASVTDRALFWAYVAGAFDDAWIADEYDKTVNELVESAPRWLNRLSLYGGAAGFGFALAHISEPGAADASLDTIDSLFAERLAGTWDGDFDLIRGLAGFGVYLLERGEVVRPTIDRVVDHLLATSELTPSGRTWLSGPEMLSEHQRAISPRGRYDCGVAHGVPGALVFLSRAGSSRARDAAAEVARWLDAQELPEPGFHYPASVDRDGTKSRARHAWCYGDLGTALARLGVAQRLGQSTERALAIARRTIAIPYETSLVVDAGLCHGASGLAHLYNRLFQATADPAFRDASHTWFAHAFRMHGLEGGLLTGPIGVGLALVAAIRSDEPNWDRILMCDL